MKDPKNYYQILGIPEFSDEESAKSAYRKLARQFHPDLNPHTEEKFKEINEAYDVLGRTDKKRAYDLTLKRYRDQKAAAVGQKRNRKTSEKAKKPEVPRQKTHTPKEKPSAEKQKEPPKEKKTEPSGSSTSINDLFERFLKEKFPTRAGGDGKGVFRTAEKKSSPGIPNRRGEDVTVDTLISPGEAEQGVVKTVNVQHHELCRACAGTGLLNAQSCKTCNGEKAILRLKKIDVRIPSGVKHGSKVRVSGEGGRGSGTEPDGDLFLNIQISVDDSLRIQGADVYGTVTISVADAVLGTDIQVPTLNGSVNMTVPPFTPSGKVFRLKGAGVKHQQQSGDQFVTVHIEIPKNLSEKEKALYEELARLQRLKKS